jgi:hypothetical protein
MTQNAPTKKTFQAVAEKVGRLHAQAQYNDEQFERITESTVVALVAAFTELSPRFDQAKFHAAYYAAFKAEREEMEDCEGYVGYTDPSGTCLCKKCYKERVGTYGF